MDRSRFDRLTRSLAAASSRRMLVRGLAIILLVGGSVPGDSSAKKRKKKLKFNSFGCVNVGGKCRGTNAVCCSGIYQGKKPTKAKRDRSRCVAHHEGGCTPEQSICLVGQQGLCGTSGGCLATTGNAGFCGQLVPLPTICQVCSRDTDCEALGFPPGSACTIFSGGPGCSNPGATCDGINGSSGTGCLSPAE